jgi:GT2 family glycosyltransferase
MEIYRMTAQFTCDASVIIVSFNTREILRACLSELFLAIRVRDIEVIVVDNASRDGSADMVAADFPQAQLLRSQTNLGFAAANNLAFRVAVGRYIILLNPDTLIAIYALDAALGHMDASPDVGLAGGRLVGRDGLNQPSARQFPSLFNELLVLSGLAARFPRSRLFGRFDRTWADPYLSAEVDWVPGAFVIIRHDALQQVGEFDERFFLYYEEVDLCRRFKKLGWKIWYWPDIEVEHLGGESSRTVENVEFTSSGSQLILWRMRSGLLYYRKHHGFLTTWLVAQLESGWHGLRAFKARHANERTNLGDNQRCLAKEAESQRIVSLMRQAWQETLGGRVSPPRPW